MKDNIKQLLLYGLCGGITTAINLFLFYLFNEIGIYYLLSNIIAYYIAVVVNFLLNNQYVFKKGEKNIIKKLGEFLILRTGSLVADSGIFYFLVSVLEFHVYVSRVGLSIVIILFNYVISRKKIFL